MNDKWLMFLIVFNHSNDILTSTTVYFSNKQCQLLYKIPIGRIGYLCISMMVPILSP